MRSGIQDTAAGARHSPLALQHTMDTGNYLLAPNVCVCVCVFGCLVPALGERLPTACVRESVFHRVQDISDAADPISEARWIKNNHRPAEKCTCR